MKPGITEQKQFKFGMMLRFFDRFFLHIFKKLFLGIEIKQMENYFLVTVLEKNKAIIFEALGQP